MAIPLVAKVARAWHRKAACLFGRRLTQMPNVGPLISFTFDDFPRSALWRGGTILRERGFVGTYYVSLWTDR